MLIARPRKQVAADKKPEAEAHGALLKAADHCLRKYGYAGLSTRRVADAAGVPLSQIHYHFGSKDSLVLALLGHQNERLLQRQANMYGEELPLWKRWEKACDYLDEDLASGYVRILQEMLAAGMSNPPIARAMREFLGGWFALLGKVAAEAGERFGSLGPLKPGDVASLVATSFLGSELLLLLGFEDAGVPLRRALRRVGGMIRSLEEAR